MIQFYMQANRLKQQFKYLFWDTDISSLSTQAIIERVLAYGTWQDIKKLLKILPRPELKRYYLKIRNKKRTNLSPRTIAFWDNMLEIKNSKYYIN